MITAALNRSLPFSRLTTGLATLALVLTLAPLAAQAGISGMNPKDVSWQSLHYQASRGIATLTVDISLRPLSAKQVNASAAAREGLPALKPPAGPVQALQANIRLKHLFGDYRTADRLWFRPGNGAVVEREKVRSGSKQYVKSYRYDAKSTHRLRVRPDDKSERKLKPQQWTDRRHSVYGYRDARKSCKVVSEPGIVFYVVAAHDFSNGKPVQLCVFSDSALFHMTIQPIGTERIDVNYALTSKGKTSQIKGQVDALALRVTARKLPGFSDNADFEVLDFKGDQTLYIDPARRIPLRISGSIQGMGNGDVDITAVTLR